MCQRGQVVRSREGACADELHPTDATAIGEGGVPAVGIPLPARAVVFDRAAVAREAGRALRAGFLRRAVGGEPVDSRPGPLGSGLAGLGVAGGGEGTLMGQAAARGLQVGRAEAPLLPPDPEALV